jgi:hypothetical protein
MGKKDMFEAEKVKMLDRLHAEMGGKIPRDAASATIDILVLGSMFHSMPTGDNALIEIVRQAGSGAFTAFMASAISSTMKAAGVEEGDGQKALKLLSAWLDETEARMSAEARRKIGGLLKEMIDSLHNGELSATEGGPQVGQA